MVDERKLERDDFQRLRPEMSSRRLLVLAFVERYIREWRGSPSAGEIAAACGISRPHATYLVQSLARAGLLTKRPGPRGLGLPGEANLVLPQRPALDYDPSSDTVAEASDGRGEQSGKGTGAGKPRGYAQDP